jgi:hypothetical protein
MEILCVSCAQDLADTRTGAIILIMHRLHEHDLAGHISSCYASLINRDI